MSISKEPKDWIVLIVDDERDNVGVADKVLRFNGAHVYTAVNGQQGLEMLAALKPTFILLDLSMPVMNGWEMLKSVRSNPETSNLTVIALTAHAMDGDRERVIAAGFDDYISKPFRIDAFLENIKSCLERIQMARH